MSHDHYISPSTRLLVEMASIRRRVQERGEYRYWHSPPVLRPLHRMVRTLIGATTMHPVAYQRGCAEPHWEGRRGYSPAGRTWRGYSTWPGTRYRRSTLCAAVGIDWPGLATPDPSLAWDASISEQPVRQIPPLLQLEHLKAVRQSVPAPVIVAEIVGAWNEEYRSWLMSRCAEYLGTYAVARDDYGTLVEFPGARESVRAVQVQCPTTGRKYLLRVPPTAQTAHEAIAWTFSLTPDEYHPAVQS